MQKIAVITCFSYLGNKKYVFNQEYLRADLRRIVSFSHNKIGCPLERIYILSDLRPSEQIQLEILDDFQSAVKADLREIRIPRGILNDALRYSQKYEGKPLVWLKSLSARIDPRFPNYLYQRLLQQILPVIRSSSVVEFASLFTNLINISGEHEYRRRLESIFQLPMTHLFFYYSGHGIRVWPTTSRSDVCLLIPRSEQVDLQSGKVVKSLFKQIINNIHALIVFDCCHAEGLIDLPYKMTFTSNQIGSISTSCEMNGDVIYLSSTLNHQTCGFYTSDNEHGSLYTYYLIRFLGSIKDQQSVKLSQLKLEVEEKIRQYRIRQMKPPQNMLIGLSRQQIEKFPSWIFERSDPGFDLIEAD